MRHLVVHYKNKYPGARVSASDDALDVYLGDEHVVAIRKNGAGQIVDVSAEMGCRDRHDLAPIPKESRVYKLCPQSGHIIRDEKADEREKSREKFMQGGKVQSCAEMGLENFDEKQRLVK